MGNKKALILALICAAIASVMVYRTLQTGSRPKIIPVPKIGVVFAKTTIPAKTLITETQLEIRSIPHEAVNQNIALKFKDVVGFTTKSEILQGEPVNLNRLFRKGENPGLSLMIPEGMRAITIPVNEVLGVAGFIKPGEKVDLIGTIQTKNGGESISWTLLQDVEVLAVAQDMGQVNQDPKITAPANAKVGTSVTLAVTPLQAQKIVLGEEKGVIHLTLRPAVKEAEQNIPAIRESNLIPAINKSATTPKKQSSKTVIEVISGGRRQFITVN